MIHLKVYDIGTSGPGLFNVNAPRFTILLKHVGEFLPAYVLDMFSHAVMRGETDIEIRINGRHYYMRVDETYEHNKP